MSLTSDLQQVVDYHAAQGYGFLHTPEVAKGAFGKATQENIDRVGRVYTLIRMVETVRRQRLVYHVPKKGHKIRQRGVTITQDDIRDAIDWMLGQARHARTRMHTSANAAEALGELLLELGHSKAGHLIRIGATLRAMEASADGAVHTTEAELSSI